MSRVIEQKVFVIGFSSRLTQMVAFVPPHQLVKLFLFSIFLSPIFFSCEKTMKLPPPDTKRRSLLSRAPFKSKTCFSSAAPVYSGLGETGDAESDLKEDSVWRDGVFVFFFS